MVFNEFEENLLNVAVKHFSPEFFLDRLKIFRKYGWGIENWFQNELLYAWINAHISTNIRNKEAYDADILPMKADGTIVPVELRCTRRGDAKRLIDAIEKHGNAELYLFLSGVRENLLDKLNEYFQKNGYIETHKLLNTNWILILVKKSQK